MISRVSEDPDWVKPDIRSRMSWDLVTEFSGRFTMGWWKEGDECLAFDLLWYFLKSLSNSAIKGCRMVAKYIYEIERVIGCLQELEEIIRAFRVNFYLLNASRLPAPWYKWHNKTWLTRHTSKLMIPVSTLIAQKMIIQYWRYNVKFNCIWFEQVTTCDKKPLS